jgi:nitrogen-specific signal transduction histidine kinase/ActR/RegA family two-component response regulator
MGTYGVARDISVRKRMEFELHQTKKMKAIGTLAGGIAHDFNNLLMGIQGNTSLMLIDTDSNHPNYKRLKKIEENVKSCADVTKQLLGFARGGKYDVKPTDLNELVKKTSMMFGITKKEITIHSKYQEGIWTVEVDQAQIEQVLLNLYVNACQAMPGGGDLHLETKNFAINENIFTPYRIEPGKYVNISITDTGIGMDEATMERIFDPFFTTKEMGRGIGLGLASVYGIIKNHGGTINVLSEKGEGTTFDIYLPALKKEALEEKKSTEEILKGTETILLVDDDETILDVDKNLLKVIGHEVLLAGSGTEALDVYKKNQAKIDLVILDMAMPAMDGGELYDRLKEINPDIKTLLSSGYSIDGQATEILERGCNGFIQKPFNVSDLSRKLREIFDK